MPDTSPEPAPTPRVSPTQSTLRYVAGFVILAAGLALGARTVRSALHHDSSLAVAGIERFTDTTERDRRLRDVVGIFATGNEPGDRGIEVRADGHVRLFLIGPLRNAFEREDTFQLGKHGKQVCLETRASGVIDALDIDQLTYCDDVYVRTK